MDDDYVLPAALPPRTPGRFVRGGGVRPHTCSPPAPPVPLTEVALAQWPELPLWLTAGEILEEMRGLEGEAVAEAGGYIDDVYRMGAAAGGEAIPTSTTGMLCYIFGGGDLLARIRKGTFISGFQRPGVSFERAAEAKRNSARKIIAYLSETLLPPAASAADAAVDASPSPPPQAKPTFLYVTVQPLGGAWRAEHLLYVDPHERGGVPLLIDTTDFRRTGLDPAKYVTLLETLLLSTAGGGVRGDAFAALFGGGHAGVGEIAADAALGCCVQSQDFLPEAITRRWWSVLRWGGCEEVAFTATVARAAAGVSTTLTLAEAERRGLLASAAAPLALRSRQAKHDAADTAVLDRMYHAGDTFALQSYERMRDDADRTEGYRRAIHATCRGKVVVEIGTGPFALLSIFAARAGASHVYAIESDANAAKSARGYIKNAGFSDTITVLEGLSTHVVLPPGTKGDVVVHELIGVLATEEGVVETLQDAAARLLVADFISIPYEVKTLCNAYEVPITQDPMWKCRCCYGGWSLGTGVARGSALAAAPATVECLTFTRERLPTTSSTETCVSFDVHEAGMARGVAVWVTLQLLAGDTEDQLVSSLKDTSCWPKMLVSFEKRASIFPGCKFALRFTSERAHPMRYTFEMEGTGIAPVVVQTGGAGWTGLGGGADPLLIRGTERSRLESPSGSGGHVDPLEDPAAPLPPALDAWVRGERDGVLVEGAQPAMETRLTHVEGARVTPAFHAAALARLDGPAPPNPATRVTLRQCRLENTLSPLHRVVVAGEPAAIGGVGAGIPARGWAIRDGLWGLSAAHMAVLASGGRCFDGTDVGATAAAVPQTGPAAAVKDASFQGTPAEWGALLRRHKRHGPPRNVPAPHVRVPYRKRDGSVETLTRDTFRATVGREYAACDVVGYDFVLSAMLRCRITLPDEEGGGKAAAALDDSGNVMLTEEGPVVAAKAFAPGAFVCRLHGEAEPERQVAGDPGCPPEPMNRQHYPSPDIPFYLNTTWRCSPGCLIRAAAFPNCERSLRPYRGMLCIVVSTVRAIAAGEELTLAY